MKFIPALVLASALLVASSVSVTVASGAPRLPRPQAQPGSPSPPAVHVLDTIRRIDANDVNMWNTNFGHVAYDAGAGAPGLVFPKGSGKRAMFAAGLWLGARVAGEIRAVVAEYSSEYGPGRMLGSTFDDPSRPEYVVYKVARWTGDPQDSAHVERTPAELAADPDLDVLVH